MKKALIALAFAASAGPGLWAASPQAGAPARPSSPAGGATPQSAAAPPGGAYYEFILGLQLDADGDVNGAIAAYERAARLEPTAAEIPAALAELYARQDRSADAMAAGERAVKANPQNPEANWVLGRIYAAMSETPNPRDAGRTEYASRAIQHLERADSNAHPSVRLSLGRLYIRVREFGKAISLLGKYVAEEPDQIAAIGMLAEAYAAEGRTEEAIALLERAAPEAPDLNTNLGELYDGQRRWRDAANAYGAAAKVRPRSLSLRLQWASALLNTGAADDAKRAREVLEEVGAGSSTNLRALYLLSQAQRRTSDATAAEATARKMIQVDPNNLLGPFALAQVLEEQHEYRKIVDALDPVIAKWRNQPEAVRAVDLVRLYLQVGTAYEQLREFDQAIDAFTQARSLAPQDPSMDIHLSLALIAAGRMQAAIDATRRASEQYPGDLRVARLQARALRLGGRVDDSINVMKAVVSANADDPSAYLGLAEAYADGDRMSEAIAVLQEASTKFPREGSIKVQLGALFERQKRYADAERIFRQVIADDPHQADALNSLGYMLAERGERLEESVEYVQRALALDPGNAAYLDSLGWAYFKLNRLDLAERHLREASAQMQTSSVVQSHLGDVLFKVGQFREAIDAWQRALAGDGESITRADIEGKIKGAKQKLDKKK